MRKLKKLRDLDRDVERQFSPRGALLSLDDFKQIRRNTEENRASRVIDHIKQIAGGFISEPLNEACSGNELSDEQSLRKLLFRKNPAARLISFSAGIARFAAPNVPEIPSLPMRYGYKGGCARLALTLLVGMNAHRASPRDLDLVRFGNPLIALDRFRDRQVSAQYMREDSIRGDGVEVVSSIEEYLSTRDIVLNEVVVIGGHVICTQAALHDCLGGVLRPSRFVKLRDGRVPLRTWAKIIRLEAEASERGQHMEIRELGSSADSSAAVPAFNAFDIALHLERALAMSEQVAKRYLDGCIKYELLPGQFSKYETVAAAAEALKKMLDPGVDLLSDRIGAPKTARRSAVRPGKRK